MSYTKYFILFSYIEANRSDHSNIIKGLLLKSFKSNSSTKTETKETNYQNEAQPDNLKNRKKLKFPLRLLYELKKYCDLIFYDLEFFKEKFEPKYPILHDNAEFIKYKNHFAYDMEIIYSYTPKTKTAKSSSDNKKIENTTSLKSHSDQGKKKHESDNNKIFTSNVIKAKIDNCVIPINNTKNTGCFNLFNKSFFSNQVFKNDSNTNSIRFLNTKRIQKITTPISTKIINSSPFKEKTTFLIKKNNSAFRNLQNEFEEKK